VVSCASTPVPQQKQVEMLADIDPFDVGVFTASCNKFFLTDIEEKVFTCKLVPRENTVEVGFLFQGCKFRWYLDSADRAALIQAVSLYNADFTNKKLNKKGNKSAYGIIPVYVRWGLVTLNAEATVKLQVGYTFINGAPYFSIISPTTPEEKRDSSSGPVTKNTPVIALYCTRAQANELATILSQEYLLEKLGEQNIPESLLPERQKALSTPDVY